jgi:hypothetical protein
VFEGINVDMDFLVDMNTTQISTGQVARIIEAKGQFRGRIDRKGALVVEEVGMRAVMESCGPRGEALVIDDAFLAIFEKTGVGPVSVLFVAEDCWTVADGPVVTPTEPSHDEARSDSGGESEAYRPE